MAALGSQGTCSSIPARGWWETTLPHCVRDQRLGVSVPGKLLATCLFHGSHARKLPVAKLAGLQVLPHGPVGTAMGSAPLPALPLLFSPLFSMQPKGAAAAGSVLPQHQTQRASLACVSPSSIYPCMNVNGESHGSLPTSTATGQGSPSTLHPLQAAGGAHCCPVFPGALVCPPHPNPCFSFIADSQLGI